MIILLHQIQNDVAFVESLCNFTIIFMHRDNYILICVHFFFFFVISVSYMSKRLKITPSRYNVFACLTYYINYRVFTQLDLYYVSHQRTLGGIETLIAQADI